MLCWAADCLIMTGGEAAGRPCSHPSRIGRIMGLNRVTQTFLLWIGWLESKQGWVFSVFHLSSIKKYLTAGKKRNSYRITRTMDCRRRENTNDIKTVQISTPEYTFSQTFVWWWSGPEGRCCCLHSDTATSCSATGAPLMPQSFDDFYWVKVSIALKQ